MRAALLVVVVRVLVKVEQVLVVLPEELVEFGVLLSEAAEVLFVVCVVVGRTIIIIASFLGWQSSLIKVNSSPTQLLTGSRNPRVWRFFDCCTADFQTDYDPAS